jgi:hypothetical protein
MKLSPFSGLLSALALVLALAGAASAAETAPIVGTWDIVATTPQGDMPSVLTVAMVDGKLKAEYELAGALRTVTDEKLEGSVLSLKVEYEGGVYEVAATLSGDTLDGTWQGNGYSGTLKAKRRL